jgi:hypothetical protein
VDRDLQRRLAANEDTFRDVNEGIARGQSPGEPDEPITFRCECARLGCNALIALTLREYEAVRGHGRRFVLVPGHELPEVETVVERGEGYLVVEKRDEAGRLAERLDDSDE